MLHGLHNPFWAPEAHKVIATGAEALAAAATHLMPKRWSAMTCFEPLVLRRG